MDRLTKKKPSVALEELLSSNKRYESLFNVTSDAIFCYEYEPPIPTNIPTEEQIPLFYDGILVECNAVAAKTYQAENPVDVIGKSIQELFNTEPGGLDDFYRMFIEQGYKVTGLEAEEVLPDGSKRRYQNNGFGVIEDGKLQRVWGTYQDITRRTQQDKLIRIQRDLGMALLTTHGLQETLELCLESAIQISDLDSGGIYLLNDDGGMDLVCTSGLPEEFVKVSRHYGPETPNVQLVKEGKPIYSKHEELGIDVDGPRKQEGLRGIGILPILYNDEVIACLNIASHTLNEVPEYTRDSLDIITNQIGIAIARSKTEKELQDYRENLENMVEQRSQELYKSEARFRAIYENNPLGIITVDTSSKIIDANTTFLSMLDFEQSDLIGKTIQELTYQDDLDQAFELIKKVVIERLPTYSHEMRLINSRGQIIWCKLSSTMLYDDQDQPMLGLSIVEDITQRIEAKQSLEETSRSLARSNEELEQFAYIASHDLQEPLRKISTFSTRLQEKFSTEMNPQALDYLTRMHNASERGQQLINALLEYSRVTTKGKPFEGVNLNNIVQEVINTLEINLEESQGQINTDSLPIIEADPTQMQQLFQNLISNSLKFKKADLTPSITISNHKNDSGAIEIHVKDNGIGFDMQYEDKIFQPFQRLHGMSTYAGSGIGLSICRKIVERHGGTLTATSKPDQGATFMISFPKDIVFTGPEDHNLGSIS